MSEFCKKYIEKISGLHLGIIDDNFQNENTEEVEKFIDSESCLVLYVIRYNENSLKYFTNPTNENVEKLVIFYKSKPSVLLQENIDKILQISSVCSTSPVVALYQSLNNVFSPLMKNKSAETNNIQIQIANLQNNLRSLIFAEKPEDGQFSKTDDISLTVIDSLEREVEYWKSQNTKKDRLIKKMSNYFIENLEPLAKEYSVIDVLPINELDDLLEKTHNVFDDIWKFQPPFPIERMTKLMDIIGSEISNYSSKQLKQIDIWEVDFSKISENLQSYVDLGEKWLSTCKQLTEIFWPNYGQHPWTEKVYQPNNLVNFILLVKQILNFRKIHKQLTRLLTKEEQDELDTKDMFKPFKQNNILSYTDDVNKHLFKFQKQFEYLLQPAEKRVALKLKRQLSSVNSNIRQLLYEFSRYSDLISRPILKQSLQPERQYLMTSLHGYLKEIQSQATTENINIYGKQEIPQNIKEIMNIRQLEARVNDVLKVAEKILDDLPGFESLHQNIVEVTKDLKQQHTELFESWNTDVMGFINNDTLTLKESDPVVRFSKNKLMIVTYNPRLTSLISEVRQLRTMGYHIPNVIEQTAEHAKKFMRYARILEQIANFHNTIGDRMIQSQKPMMLNSALELSKLVQEEKVVPWGEVEAVEKYVEILNTAVQKLSKENTLLTSYHIQIVDKIRDLDGVDLLKDFHKWKESTKFMRNTVTQVESKGFKNMQNWKNDIDKQLSVVLEKQYIKSLDKLHLNFNEIPVDLIYRNSKLEFSPNEENLKNTYEQQVKKYLEIPKSFRGVSEVPEQIFSSILDRNQDALKNVTKHESEIFEQLKNVMKHWTSWLQLENLDTTKLTTWQHWDLHFRASKTFGQEIAKLPSTEEKVGCFVIGLSRLRSDLESHNRSYWDKLVYTLKDSIAEDVVKLQNYIDPSTAALTRQPVTLEEVGEVGVTHTGIINEIPEMESTFNEMQKKSQILASWSRETVDSVNRIKTAWERLQNLLENHQHIIAKQMETIKTTLNIEKENLIKEFERFEAKWQEVKPRPNSGEISENDLEKLAKQLEEIKSKRNEFQIILERKEKLINDFNKFNLDIPEFNIIENIETDLKNEENSWKIFEDFYKNLEELQNEYWIVFRKKLHIFEDFLNEWESKVTKTSSSTLELKILQEITKYKDVYPCLKYVRGEDFSEKHWLDVFNLFNIEAKPVDQILFKDFLNVSEKLLSYQNELQIISKKAASEIVVRQALAELDNWDVQTKFVLIIHKDSNAREINIIKDFKEILNKVGDNQSLLQSLQSSANYDNFSERVSTWETKLNDLDDYVSSLAQIQRKWIYLEPIFVSGTLPQERSRFEKIDRDFRHILSSIEKNNRVTHILRYPNLRTILENLQDQLARCQNSLNDFLKQKREKFPRFLFLSDDDLLEIVGQSSKEQVIQNHLKKIFSGINSIKLDHNLENITAMCSSHGEIVDLSKKVFIKKPVEDWLNDLVTEMQSTLKQLLVKCQMEKQAPDPMLYPSQILCLAESISFTNRCESAISNISLSPLLAKYKTQLSHYTSLEFDLDQSDYQVLELKLKSLLLDTIHHISIIEELLENNVTKTSDWIWQKQLRFYSNSTGDATIKMANSKIDYSYEYLGNPPKLVRTPLTEKCFLTLTQSLHLGMGGNPYGPAGTGKTESVKALGCLLGRQVLVFNCDEGIDASSMSRILIGLVKTGAWGCFDEFNRLDQATLSAISMVIHPIQEALRSNALNLKLSEEEFVINRHCGIFITLNPAGGGYGGRNKLPDNLKQLFRPVVMTQPDNEQISRCLLYCDGFKNASEIAKKIVEVFGHAEKILSKQQHYDWGLRAIRTILSGCGRALKKYKNNKSEIAIEDEYSIVVDVIKTDTLSKLTFYDSIKFDGILKDVFKGVQSNSIDNKHIEDILNTCFDEMNLIANKRQIQKCIEFLEQLKQRMGVAIVGPSSSGKTTIRNLVFKALQKLNKIIKKYEFNPKSITRQQLLGANNDINQWSDGVLTNFSLQVSSESHNILSWIVCDGDIDPEWVESLNSVLDDNRLLSLPSGWRIQFDTNVNFIFETHNLDYASPATISRMGVVFLSDNDVEINNFIKKELNTFPDESKIILEPLLDEYFFKAVDWTIREAETTIIRSKISIAKTCLCALKYTKSKPHFVNNIINSLGQQLQTDFREIFAQQMYEWTKINAPPQMLKSGYNKERDFVETYYTNPNISLENIGNDLPLVETGQIKLYLEMLELWFNENEKNNFLVVGPHGSAKNLMIKYLVEQISNVEMFTVFCSPNLMPDYIVDKLMQHCIMVNTHKGKTLKPKKGNLVLYFKNIHLLKKDKWSTSIIIEFLRQLINYEGFFDKNIEFVRVENVYIIGSLQSTNNISSRFTSNIHIFNVALPEQEDVIIIFSAYLNSIIKQHFPTQNFPKSKIIKLVQTLILLYEKIKNCFNLNKAKHYVFSPHDIKVWCKNIGNYSFSQENSEKFENFLIEIIVYELYKNVGDKLVTFEEKNKLCNILNETFNSQFNMANITNKILDIYYVPANKKIVELEKLNKNEWFSSVEMGIKKYEREGYNLDIIINNEILDLSCSILKNISLPYSHIVLIGKSGTGRRTSIKIASSLRSAKIVSICSDKQPYFNNTLKQALQWSGIENFEVYLQFEDNMFENDSNLNLINLLILSGEVPNLYTSTELESLVSYLKEEHNNDNSENDLVQYFYEKVRRNLHVIIYLDSDNDNLFNTLSNCPALMYNSSIIFKTKWANESIKEISEKIIKKTENNSIELNNNFANIYNETKLDITTPSRFISMIKLYIKTYDEKLQNINLKKLKLQAGVDNLNDSKNYVSKLKQNALQQQEKLAEKQSKANTALDMISSTMKNASSHKEEMESLKSKTEQENSQLMKRKKEIEIELSEVEPLIQQARQAVGNIKPESLSEIRSLRAPPDTIRDILEGVLRLMGIQDTSWNSMKTFLSKRGVKEDIRSFDASRIQSENRQAVERLMNLKSDSFDSKAAKRASVAAAPLAAWVAANVKYSYVMDKIKPLEKEQNKLKQNLTNAEAQLGELSAGLLDVDATVAKLKEQLSAYTREAAAIEIDLQKAKETLQSAEGLVEKLSDEYVRWQDQLKKLSEEEKKLSNDCLIASAFVSFLSEQTEHKRKQILNAWQNILSNSDFNFESFFSSEREQMLWQIEGLNSDKLSIQNAIILNKVDLVPLIIDPTSKVTDWIKNHYKNKQMECITQNSTKFNTTLELSIRFGKILIIEEIEKISHSLLPIVRKEFIIQGERKLIKLNDKTIDFHNDFKIILTTRNEKFKLPSNLSPLITVLNFIVTHEGLTEQLLLAAVTQESPKLEEERKKLLREKEEFQEKRELLQNKLLEDLGNSRGDILQNKQLLESLNETKASSIAIEKSLLEFGGIQEKLQKEYDEFREISHFGSSLYFAINSFSKSNIFYVISIKSFRKLFLKSLQTFEGIENNIQNQKKHLIDVVYSYITRGIFKEDRIKFLLHFCHELFPKEISENEWNVFLGNVFNSRENNENMPPWIPKSSQIYVQNIQSFLPDFYKKLQLEEYTLWKEFMTMNNCENYFPSHIKNSKNFHKILITQMLRRDRLQTVITQNILEITSLKNIDPSILELNTIFKESENIEPILILTTTGTDPSFEVRNLATRLEKNFIEVAMGENQKKNALEKLQKFSNDGGWLILKNLHLVSYWLPELCENLRKNKPHDNFRLFLISEPCENFSFVLAQNSLKIVYETPRGLKNNIIRTYSTFGEKNFERFSPTTSRIFFVTSCVHALLEERRKYIPQGWSKYYEFNNTDFSTAIKLFEDIWQTQGTKVPWTYISKLFSNVYSGRIENNSDIKILESYTNEYFIDDVLSHRFKPFGVDFNMPSSASFKEYLSSVKKLPNKDNPVYFGLPQNIDRAWERQISEKNIMQLKNFSSQISSDTLEKETYHKQISTFLNLWKKLNSGRDFIRTSIPENSNKTSPVANFIENEYKNALILIQMIHKCFSNLNKISKGIIQADSTDLEVLTSLLKYKTPNLWINTWKGPTEADRYLKSILDKAVKLEKIQNNTDISINNIDISVFLRPDGFVASTKQEYSRNKNISMEKLHIQTSWTSAESNSSIILKDIQLEGGILENFVLKKCQENDDNLFNVQRCYLNWSEKISGDDDATLRVPLYKNQNRDEKILTLTVPCDGKDIDKWVQSGLAFYLE